MKKAFQKIIDGLNLCERTLIVAFYAILVLGMLLNIILRNVGVMTISQISEFAPGAVLWLALLGASQAIAVDRHIKLEFLLRFIKPKLAIILRTATDVLAIVVMAILFYLSLFFVKEELTLLPRTGWLSVIFPFFFFSSGLRFFLSACQRSNG